MTCIISSLKIEMGPLMWKTLHYLHHDPSMSPQMDELWKNFVMNQWRPDEELPIYEQQGNRLAYLC